MNIFDSEGADWTTCEDVQAADDIPFSCKRKNIPETNESRR